MSCLEKKSAEIEDDVNVESVNNIKVVKKLEIVKEKMKKKMLQ